MVHIAAMSHYLRCKQRLAGQSKMADSPRGKGKLVADRRYPKSKSAPASKPKAAPKKRKATKKPVKGGNVVTRGIRGLFRWIFRVIWLVTSRVTAVGLIILGLAVAYFYAQLPEAKAFVDGRAQGSVTMYDRNGQVFAWRGDQFGGAVTADSVSPHLKNAVIATEDKRFYWHLGISPRGIASAVRINLREGRGPLQGHGGSTITQQTAKLLCLGVEYDPAVWETEA